MTAPAVELPLEIRSVMAEYERTRENGQIILNYEKGRIDWYRAIRKRRVVRKTNNGPPAPRRAPPRT